MTSSIDWDQVAEKLGPRLYQYFSRRGGPNEASDLTQETLLRLYDKVEAQTFDESKGSLEQFSFGIARLVWLEHSKDLRTFVELSEKEMDPRASMEERASEKQTRSLVRKAVSELSSVQQDVVALILDHELAIKDISTILELPENTVKSHIHRAKESLRSELVGIWENL